MLGTRMEPEEAPPQYYPATPPGMNSEQCGALDKPTGCGRKGYKAEAKRREFSGWDSQVRQHRASSNTETLRTALETQNQPVY